MGWHPPFWTWFWFCRCKSPRRIPHNLQDEHSLVPGARHPRCVPSLSPRRQRKDAHKLGLVSPPFPISPSSSPFPSPSPPLPHSLSSLTLPSTQLQTRLRLEVQSPRLARNRPSRHLRQKRQAPLPLGSRPRRLLLRHLQRRQRLPLLVVPSAAREQRPVVRLRCHGRHRELLQVL